MTIEEILAKSNPLQPQKETSQSEYKKLVDTNTKLIDKMKYQEEEIERLNKSLEEQRHFYLNQLQQKENIIKEVREEIRILESNCDISDYQAQKLFQILDKGE